MIDKKVDATPQLQSEITGLQAAINLPHLTGA